MDRQQQDEQDVEFEVFLRQFRPRRPPTFKAGRLSRLVTPRRLAIAAAVLLACAIPLRFLGNQSGSRDQVNAAAPDNGSLPASSAAQPMETSALGRTLNLLPSVEATLSASAPPAPRNRVDVSLPAVPRRKVIARVKPEYPPDAQRLGVEGHVVLKLTVDSAGGVTNIERISGSVNLHPDEKNGSERTAFYAANPYTFSVASEAAARQWKFEAATSGMTCFVSFTFHLTPGPDLTRSTTSRRGSATLSAPPGSSRPGLVPGGGPLQVDGQAIKPPMRLVNVNPVYPEDAQAAQVQGVVILQITIGEDGSVTNTRVLHSIPMLDQAAIDAVLQWIYEPTLLNGVPVEVQMTVTINFTLP